MINTYLNYANYAFDFFGAVPGVITVGTVVVALCKGYRIEFSQGHFILKRHDRIVLHVAKQDGRWEQA